jgi:hypothetical protein
LRKEVEAGRKAIATGRVVDRHDLEALRERLRSELG